MSTLIDSYGTSNYSGNFAYSSIRPQRGQSFTALAANIDSAQFYLARAGSPTGNVYARLYAHTGTFGSTGKPTGAALAVSDAVDVSTVSTSANLVTFTFSGANRYLMTDAENYVITLDTDKVDEVNYLYTGLDSSSPAHGGNYSYYYTPTSLWYSSNTYDLIFYVYGTLSGSSVSASPSPSVSSSPSPSASSSYSASPSLSPSSSPSPSASSSYSSSPSTSPSSSPSPSVSSSPSESASPSASPSPSVSSSPSAGTSVSSSPSPSISASPSTSLSSSPSESASPSLSPSSSPSPSASSSYSSSPSLSPSSSPSTSPSSSISSSPSPSVSSSPSPSVSSSVSTSPSVSVSPSASPSPQTWFDVEGNPVSWVPSNFR